MRCPARPSAAITLAFVLGCAPSAEDVANGDDPIAALRAAARSTRYDGPYWAEQHRTGASLWQQAVDVCTGAGLTQYPNCEPVLANLQAERGNARADSVLRTMGEAARKRPR